MEAAVALLLALCAAGTTLAVTVSPAAPTQGVPCPPNCSCVASHRHVTCRAGLTSLPEGLPTDTRELRLSSNLFPILGPGCLSNLSSLTALHLTGSQVSLVQPGAFQGLSSLQYLHLDDNRIERLEVGVFDDLTAVTYLYLTNNQISSLTPGLFSSMKRLNSLDLSGNRLTEIPSRAFKGLAKLRWLSLSRNLLAGVPRPSYQDLRSLQRLRLDGNLLTDGPSGGLDPLGRLAVLDLSGNRIARLRAGSLTSSRRLRLLAELRLDNNSLRAVHPAAFSRLPRLRLLSLAGNELDTLAPLGRPGRLGQRLRLRLAGNPWLCDCRLAWLWRRLRSTDRGEAKQAECGSPDALAGLALDQVTLQQLTCPPFAPNSSTVPPRPVTAGASASFSRTPATPSAAPGGAGRTLEGPGLRQRQIPADPCLAQHVRDVEVSEAGESTLLVNWRVDRDLGDEYEVRYKTGDRRREVRMIGGVNEVELSELSPGAHYTVCVVPQGGEGGGEAAFGPCLQPEPGQCTLAQTLASSSSSSSSSWAKRRQVAFRTGLAVTVTTALLLAACLAGYRLRPKAPGFQRHHDEDGEGDEGGGGVNPAYVEQFAIDQGGCVNQAAAGDRAGT